MAKGGEEPGADFKGDFSAREFTFSGIKAVEADDLAAELRKEAMDMQEAKFARQAQELEGLGNRFEDLFHKVDKFETKVGMVKMFEEKLQEYAENKVEVETRVNAKLQDFELQARTQSSQLKDVAEESRTTAASTLKFRGVMDRLEQEIDAMRSALSEKMTTNHQQLTKKLNLATYETENYRGDIMKLKS